MGFSGVFGWSRGEGDGLGRMVRRGREERTYIVDGIEGCGVKRAVSGELEAVVEVAKFGV